MHKKEMRNWMFIISIFLLVACDEVAYLRNDEKPVLVLNAVLEAGCDSMRIELTETKGAYDQSPWQRFPEAEVRVYEEGELLGMAEYQLADSSFVLRQPVKAERTYRIEAQVAGKGMVWGETQVPRSPERYDFEITCSNRISRSSFLSRFQLEIEARMATKNTADIITITAAATASCPKKVF